MEPVLNQSPVENLNVPILVAGAGTLISVGCVAVAVLLTGRVRGLFLVWNLWLAWLPLAFALFSARDGATRRERWFWGALWLLFFPNAPYIFTDLVHAGGRAEADFWMELGAILNFAMLGLFVGFLSLHRMQQLIRRHFGPALAWGVVIFSCLLASGGVAIGRFLRWNSWDALTHPGRLLRDIAGWLAGLPQDRHTLAFLGLFALFLWVSYGMFHAMAFVRAPESATHR